MSNTVSSLLLLPVVAVLALAACSPSRVASDDEPLQARIAALQGAGERVLDAREDGAILVARERPALPDSDEALQLELRVVLPDGRSVLLPGIAQDGRFLPGSSALVTVQSSGVLLLHPGATEAPRQLDTGAHGPLAVAPGRVVYARGEVADQELFSWDQGSGQVAALTERMAPVWSPALSEDGKTVVFVSAQSGFPEVYESQGGAPRKVTDRASDPAIPFPSSPRGPRLREGILYFEADGATQGLGLSSGRVVWSALVRGAPVMIRQGALVIAHERGAAVVKLDGGSR